MDFLNIIFTILNFLLKYFYFSFKIVHFTRNHENDFIKYCNKRTLLLLLQKIIFKLLKVLHNKY